MTYGWILLVAFAYNDTTPAKVYQLQGFTAIEDCQDAAKAIKKAGWVGVCVAQEDIAPK